MKKRLLACGLVPALVLGTFGTVGAQPAADAAVQLKQGGAPAVQANAADEPVTQESLKELRSQLEEQLYEAQELQKRLNAQLDSLNKRVSKVEKKTDQPAVDIHGYGRFRWDKQHFEDFKGIDMKSVWMNLFVNHRINDKWSLHSEHEFENNLSNNHGAYEGDGGYDKDGGKSIPVRSCSSTHRAMSARSMSRSAASTCSRRTSLRSTRRWMAGRQATACRRIGAARRCSR